MKFLRDPAKKQITTIRVCLWMFAPPAGSHAKAGFKLKGTTNHAMDPKATNNLKKKMKIDRVSTTV